VHRFAITTLCTLVLLAAPAVAPAQWSWTGEAAGNEWHDCDQIPDTNPPIYINNWGITSSTPCPLALPGPFDTATIATGGGPPTVYNTTDVGHLVVAAGGTLEVYGDLRPTWSLESAGSVALGHDGLLWGCSLETTGTGSIFSNHSNQSVLPPPTLRDVTLLGEVSADGGDLLALDVAIVNGGILSSTGGFLAIASDLNLTGGGAVTLDGGYFGGLGSAGSFRLTNQDNVISGSGVLGTGSASGTTTSIGLTNHALVLADRTPPLRVAPDPSPDDGGYSVVNDGILRASGGGTLELLQGSYNNTGGQVEALDGSHVDLSYGASLFGGTLLTAGTGAIRTIHPAGSSDPDPTLSNLTVTGLVEIPAGMLLQVRDTITNNGTVSVLGGWAQLYVGAAATLTGTGTVALSGDGTGRIEGVSGVPAVRLTNQQTLRGSGSLGYTNLAVTNHGLVVADQPAQLEVRPALSAADGQPPFVNRGTLRATSGATLRLYGDASYDNDGGVIEALDGSVVELDQGTWVTGGTFSTSGSGVIRTATQAWRRSWVSGIANQGLLSIPWGKELGVAGTITNHGTIANDWLIAPTSDVTFAGTGELVLGPEATIWPDGSASVTNLAGHTIRTTGTSFSRLYAPLTNHGRVEVAPGTQLIMQVVPYQPQLGSTTRVDGTLTLMTETTIAGTLGGSGMVSGTLLLGPDGILSPGAGTGTLTTGTLNLEDGARYQWGANLLGTDLVDVNGTLNFGSATLTVDVYVGSGPTPTEITLFEYDSLPVVPSTSQIVLTGGYGYTGISTAGNRLALTGVTVSGSLFADDFETGSLTRWSSWVPASKSRACSFDGGTDREREEVQLDDSTSGLR